MLLPRDETGSSHFGLLGPLEVRCHSDSLHITALKPRATLALLLLHHDQPVSIRLLKERLWDARPPATATAALRNYVSSVRRTLRNLSDVSISTMEDSYLLHLPPDHLDTAQFATLVATGRARLDARHPGEAAKALEAALGLWRGPALADLTSLAVEWPELGALEEARLVAREYLIDAYLALGRHAALVVQLERLTREHPLRERFYGQLMSALFFGGRQAHALAVFQRLCKELHDRVGGRPGSAVRDLHQRILEGRLGSLHSGADAADVDKPNEDILSQLIPRRAAVIELPGVTRSAAASPSEAPPATEPARGPHVAVLGLRVTTGGEKPADADALLARILPLVSSEVQRHHGHVEQIIGSVVMASFTPVGATNDAAPRAVRAAIALDRRVRVPSRQELMPAAAPEPVIELTGAVHLVHAPRHKAAAGDHRLALDACVESCRHLLREAPPCTIIAADAVVDVTRHVAVFVDVPTVGRAEPHRRLVTVRRDRPPVDRRAAQSTRSQAGLSAVHSVLDELRRTSQPVLLTLASTDDDDRSNALRELRQIAATGAAADRFAHVLAAPTELTQAAPVHNLTEDPSSGTEQPAVRLSQLLAAFAARATEGQEVGPLPNEAIGLLHRILAQGWAMVVVDDGGRAATTAHHVAVQLIGAAAGCPLLVIVVVAAPHAQLAGDVSRPSAVAADKAARPSFAW